MKITVKILLFLLLGLAHTTTAQWREKVIKYQGKPFFPTGFYYYPDDMNDPDNKELDLLRASGFNTIHIDMKDSSNCLPFFDQCHAKGIKIIAQFGHDFGKFSMGDVGLIGLYKNHPALLGWSIGDDSNNGKYVLDTIAKRKVIVKKQLPRVPSFVSVYKNHEKGISKTPEDLLPYSDVLSYEMYTIDSWGQAMGAFTKDEELLQAEKEVSIFQKANIGVHNKILVAIPQTFSWGSYTANKAAKLPSPVELRSITYSGIMNGAKGILNYTFGQKAIPDKNITYFKLPMADSLWQESVQIAKEMNLLKNILLRGSRTKIVVKGNPWLKVTRWNRRGESYIMVANLHKTAAQNLNLRLFELAGVKNLFKTRNASLKYKYGRLKGSVPAGQVQVYVANHALHF